MKLVHEFRAISHAKAWLKQSKIPTNPQLPEGTIKHKSMLICWSIKWVFMDPKNQLWILRTTLITAQHWFFFFLFCPLLWGCRVHWHLVGWWVASNYVTGGGRWSICVQAPQWHSHLNCPQISCKQAQSSMAFAAKSAWDFMQTSPILNGICRWMECFESVVHEVLQGKRDGWIALGPGVMVLWNTG